MLKTCFVIQCFDNSVYDKRYKETFAPAIERGGAKPIRADEVLGTRPVVEKIEDGLRSADVAFAEVSEDNANVFLELGYALALGVPTVIVCDKGRRTKLPFDIAHRPISFYATAAQSDYENISRDVEAAIGAAMLEVRPDSRGHIATSPPLEEQNADEVKGACLIALLDQSLRSPTGSGLWEIQKEVSSAGISERMVALAIASLIDEGLVNRIELTDHDGDPFNKFALSESGTKFLLRSYSTLIQQERERVHAQALARRPAALNTDLDDDVPF
ncbi:hypothetical protein [Sphingomonas sp.]|uniref:hypothetical protein n=1 Tax=Sphingomonas sp. TaxID=28214 RepID=UPI003B3B95AA